MNELNQPASHMILEKIDQLVQISVDRQYELQAELWKPYQQTGYKKSLRDGGYHFTYLAESLAANDSFLFLDYIAWCKVLFVGLGLPQGALTTALECMVQALQETLPPDLAVFACSYVNAALDRLPKCAETLDPFISSESPHFSLANRYLNALLKSNRHLASQLILDGVAQGTSVKDIYLHVFQPCQQEIGRMWQQNQISVGQEHYCTVATQMIMSQLYPQIFATEKNGRRLVATAVGGELHEIGMRMVADFLEMEGWDTYYLGANTPTESILRTLKDRKADVLAISATLSLHVSKVTELIATIRSSSSQSAVKILVGGYPFNIAKNLWQQVGADGYAPDAQAAVLAANRLAEQSH